MTFDINEIMLRFPHMMEQLLQKLDNEGLAKSREVTKTWQKFIDRKMYPWLRIVNIPTILSNGNTYLHLAAKHGQIDMFKVLILDPLLYPHFTNEQRHIIEFNLSFYFHHILFVALTLFKNK